MEVIFEDIARTLNASHVALPGDPTRSISSTGPMCPPAGQYLYQTQPQQLAGDISRLTVGGSPTSTGSFPPAHQGHQGHPLFRPHPQHPGYFYPPSNLAPPPPPRPGSGEAQVFRGPLPAALLAGPRNIEHQLA